MANESRKLRRAQSKKAQPSGKAQRSLSNAPLAESGPPAVDPFGAEQMRATYVRIGLIVGAAWLLGALVYGVTQNKTVGYFAIGVPLAITLGVVGTLVWTLRRAKSARAVAEVLRGVTTSEDRQEALATLERTTKKDDPAGIFARAQLELQEDPKKALATLESINLNKVMAPVADEARSQRAMIHLMLGQVSLARQLVDNIDPKRAQDARSRAMIGAIMAEAFARSGDAKRALTTLEVFELEDPGLVQIRPQLLRSYAFAYAHLTKPKELRRVLKQLSNVDVRLLGGFLQGKTHPLLTKEARLVVEQSGLVPKRMRVERMR